MANRATRPRRTGDTAWSSKADIRPYWAGFRGLVGLKPECFNQSRRLACSLSFWLSIAH